MLEERLRHLADSLVGGAFTHTNQDHAFADGHYITALQRGAAVVHIRVTPPDGEIPTFEVGMVLVDRSQVEGFFAAGRPVHRIDRYTVVDPARAVTREELVGQRREHKFRPGVCLLCQFAKVFG